MCLLNIGSRDNAPRSNHSDSGTSDPTGCSWRVTASGCNHQWQVCPTAYQQSADRVTTSAVYRTNMWRHRATTHDVFHGAGLSLRSGQQSVGQKHLSLLCNTKVHHRAYNSLSQMNPIHTLISRFFQNLFLSMPVSSHWSISFMICH
jgi:hypothetical protein